MMKTPEQMLKEMSSLVDMWRPIVHAMFQQGLINRDGVAALCDAAFDELTWIDDNYKEDAT